MRRIAIAVLVVLALVAAASCRSRGAEEHDHAAGEHPATAPTEAAAAPVIPLEGVRGVRLLRAPDRRAEGAWHAGEAIGDASAQRVLASSVGGRIVSPPFAPGRPVPRGAALLSIDSPEQAEVISRWIRAQADAARADAALAREERLFAGGATSQRELEDARHEASVAKAEIEAARSGLAARGLAESERSGRFIVRAPAAGSVVRWSVLEGQGIEAGQELGVFQTAPARLVRVDLTPPGPSWAIGDAAEVRAADGRRWGARVAGVPAVLAHDTGRLSFRLELTEGTPPLPGQPVEVRVPYAAAVILPQAAVQQIEGSWGVFVASGSGARFVPVRRGVELGSDVTIEAGVEPGDEVVAEGAYLLKSLWLKARSGGDDHDH